MLGYGAGAIAGKVMKQYKLPGLGSAIGGAAGLIHGTYASLKNQAAEANAKYSA